MDTNDVGVDADDDKCSLEHAITEFHAEPKPAPENHRINNPVLAACDTESVERGLISTAVMVRNLKPGNPFVQQTQDVNRIKDTSHQTSSTETKEDKRECIKILPQTAEHSYNHLETWLNALDCRCVRPVVDVSEEQTPQGGNEKCPSNERVLANGLWLIDSDEEEQPQPECKNPFRIALRDNQAEEQFEQDINMLEKQEKKEKLNAECQMNNFIQLIESRAAVPEYALSDAVFCVDKPKEAVTFGAELPVLSLSTNYKVGDELKLCVTEVYSPFQFWFHVVDGVNDLHFLHDLSHQITMLFASLGGSNWQLSNYFLKPGYLCAVRHEFVWRRGRIVREPATDADSVTIYFVDYGNSADVERKDLHFLHRCFAEAPALSMRGTLSDVYPLDLHWPAEATAEFTRLVRGRELHAIIKDIDNDERILFVNLAEKSNFEPCLSELLIEAKLAGRSHNYSSKLRAANCGRRLRYLRERLPTFDMLESQVFPRAVDDFEEQFDDIIYMPSFFQQFQPPKLANPFRHGLQLALANWLLKFQPEELAWRQLSNEAHTKTKQEQQKKLQLFLSEHSNFYRP